VLQVFIRNNTPVLKASFQVYLAYLFAPLILIQHCFVVAVVTNDDDMV